MLQKTISRHKIQKGVIFTFYWHPLKYQTLQYDNLPHFYILPMVGSMPKGKKVTVDKFRTHFEQYANSRNYIYSSNQHPAGVIKWLIVMLLEYLILNLSDSETI
jgi:hypothetical protein